MTDKKKKPKNLSAQDKDQLEDLAKAGQAAGAEEQVRRTFLSYFKKNKHKISFANQVEQVYDLLVSGKLTARDKAIVIGALLYFINPIDLIPDFIPFVGYLDDMAVMALAYRYLTNRAEEEQE